MKRGLSGSDARRIAAALIDRDRGMNRATGSCIECQNFVRRECPIVKPIQEIHQCWSRRHDAP
jgi:hypothetical protein